MESRAWVSGAPALDEARQALAPSVSRLNSIHVRPNPGGQCISAKQSSAASEKFRSGSESSTLAPCCLSAGCCMAAATVGSLGPVTTGRSVHLGSWPWWAVYLSCGQRCWPRPRLCLPPLAPHSLQGRHTLRRTVLVPSNLSAGRPRLWQVTGTCLPIL